MFCCFHQSKHSPRLFFCKSTTFLWAFLQCTTSVKYCVECPHFSSCDLTESHRAKLSSTAWRWSLKNVVYIHKKSFVYPQKILYKSTRNFVPRLAVTFFVYFTEFLKILRGPCLLGRMLYLTLFTLFLLCYSLCR